MRTINVIGSINVDIVYRTEHLPAVGETINAVSKNRFLGGKGCNQAVAASRVGSKVNLIGSIGADESGRYILDSLEKQKISTEHILESNQYPSGEAIIIVDDQGNNMIMVSGGANREMTLEQLPLVEDSIILMQLEIPLAIVFHVIKNKQENLIVLNLAPYRDIPIERLAGVDILVMNEVEACQLTGTATMNPEELLGRIKSALPNCVPVITLGEQGVVYLDQQVVKFPAERVVPVDTTGAGDTFTGILAGLIDRMPFQEAVKLANLGASMSTLKEGAQTGMPTLEEILDFGGHND